VGDLTLCSRAHVPKPGRTNEVSLRLLALLLPSREAFPDDVVYPRLTSGDDGLTNTDFGYIGARRHCWRVNSKRSGAYTTVRRSESSWRDQHLRAGPPALPLLPPALAPRLRLMSMYSKALKLRG
jgi:hypothetical protein